MDFEKHLLPPQKQIFWQRLAMPLQWFGLGFTQWWGMPEQPKFFIAFYYITIVFGPVSFFSQIIYLSKNYKKYSFIEIGDILAIIMVTFMAVTRVISATRNIYKKVMKNFIAVIHIYNYSPRNIFIDQVLIKVSCYDRYITVVVMVSITVNSIIRICWPFIANVTSGAYSSNGTIPLVASIYMFMPFEYEYNLKNWYIMQSINLYVVSVGTSLLGLFDSILLCTINHMIGRIKILKINFKDLADNFETYSNEKVAEMLGICIRDHVLILQQFKDLQDSHGFSVTAYYVFNLIYDALLLIEYDYGDMYGKIKFILLFVFFGGGLFGMSLIMEEIRIQSDELSDFLYFVPWERMSIPNRRILLVLLARIQPTPVYKAFAGLEAGIRPALNIMKSTISYYVMLKSLSSLEN